MATALIPQGGLNRLRASIVWNSNPTLNITPGFLAKEAISIRPDNPAGLLLATLTGGVVSGEPFQMVSGSIHLVRSISFADLYKLQFENNVQMGDAAVFTDAIAGLTAYQLSNCILTNWQEMSFAGQDAGYV